MFWLTFLFSGLTIASIPWISSHFSNRIAGYIILVPIMLTLSLIVQYLSQGPSATIEMIKGTLLALPTLLVYGLVAIFLIRHNFSLPLVVVLSIGGWLVSVITIHSVFTK